MADLILNSLVNVAVRDFDGLRQAFREYAQANFSDIWTDFNDSSFANAIAELIAYLGDNLHFYIDRQTQDSFLATTQDRQAAIDLAALINYRPFNARPASGQVTLTLDTGTFDYGTPISQGFQVSNGSDIIYESTTSITVPLASPSTTLDVIEGETIRETNAGLGPLAVADGTPFQTYILSRTNVILSRSIEDINDNEDLIVTVNGDQFFATETLSTALSSDKVFTIQTNDRDETVLKFGNGEFGVIPADGYLIEATYRVLADADTRLQQNNGNSLTGTVTTAVSSRVGVESVINLSAMTGGGPKETLEEIKINAPASLTALQRAVSLNDFAILALDVNGVAKAVATPADSDLDVLVFVAPNGGGLPSNALKLAVVEHFDDKKMPKTTVFARDPVYQNVLISLKVFIQSTFKRDEVLSSVRSAISDLFDFNNMNFGRPVLLKSTSTSGDLYDLYETLESIEGIERIEVQKFTVKPTIFEKTPGNSGVMIMSRRGSTVRSNAERAEYKIEMHSADEFVLEKAIVGKSTTLNDTTISDDSIDFTLMSGTSTDNGAGFLQDSTQAFSEDEFSGQSLIDSTGTIFLISSNTSDTISVSSGTPSAGNYSVVRRFVGYLLQPNVNRSDRFLITANTGNSFTVSGGLADVSTPGDEYRIIQLMTNEFTAQPIAGLEDPVSGSLTAFTFSSGSLNSATDNTIAGTYADDSFNGYQFILTNGDGSNLRATVVDYTGATGTFTLGTPEAITVSPTIGDEYVVAPKFIAGRDSEVDDSSFAPTATEFESSELIGLGDDYFNGWKIRFTSGTHADKVRAVSDYVSATGHFTIDSLGSAPANEDTFEISKDYEDNQKSVVFSVVRDADVASNDTFYFNSSNLVGDLLPQTIQILQVDADDESSDVTLIGVGGST